jgi:hypothetical protein
MTGHQTESVGEPTGAVDASALEGAALDYAVAMCGEWKTAHQLFPTMTLDPTFSGARLVTFSTGQQRCFLQPRNPMRQDPQEYAPSTDWAIGGPIIEREGICIDRERDDPPAKAWFACLHDPERPIYGAKGFYAEKGRAFGPTPLVAAMRAYVASRASGNQPTTLGSDGKTEVEK